MVALHDSPRLPDMRKLSVIICCYNERATIQSVIDETSSVDLGSGWDREIIVVDNYSVDGTREILEGIDREEVRLFLHEQD